LWLFYNALWGTWDVSMLEGDDSQVGTMISSDMTSEEHPADVSWSMGTGTFERGSC
jgi:hypothetical protein